MVGICYRLVRSRNPVNYLNNLIQISKRSGWVYHASGRSVYRNRVERIKEVLFVFKSKDASDFVFVVADVVGVESKFIYSWNNSQFVPDDVAGHCPFKEPDSKITWWKLTNFRRASKTYVNSLITVVDTVKPGNLVSNLKSSPRTGLWFYRTPEEDEDVFSKNSSNDGLIF